MQLIAPGVVQIGFSVVNVYLVGERGGPWVVIDTGLSVHSEQIRNTAADRFGADSRPEAILLTHGHPDHVGSALALAAYWDVPVYAHPLEAPYITGRASYPPPDPTVGGAFGFLVRFGTDREPRDLGEYYRPLPEGGTVPGLPMWRYLHTPGHAPGHVSFWRESDRVLIAGDAVLTVDTDSLASLLSKKQEVCGPPTPITTDWGAQRRSMYALAALKPQVLACGHGTPMRGPDVAEELTTLADEYIIPFKGRYVAEPARFDETGVVYLPPPAPDPLPKVAAGIAAAALLGVGLYALNRKLEEDDQKAAAQEGAGHEE